jgi:hypothetical protein
VPLTAQKVATLVVEHGIDRTSDRGAFLADAFSRIAGVEGDHTLELIAELLKARVISTNEATDLVLAHVRESAG